MRTSIRCRPAHGRLALLCVAAMYLLLGTAQVRADSDPRDIVDTAVEAGNFDTLVAAVKAAELVNTLKQPGPFTVFAPTDGAFNNLPAGTLESLLKPENKQQLVDILTYHVVSGRVSARDAYGLNNAATVNGQRLNVAIPDGKLAIDGASVVATDINCSNGVIHVIDRVLLPEQARIPAAAKKAGKFNTLLAAVSAAGLAEVLDGSGPFTVFAPSDQAFERLPEGTVASLLKPENKNKLVDILKYHVVSGRVYADQAAQAKQAKTLLGSVLETSVSAEGLRINESLVVQADLDLANGVVHVIDAVLLPEPMNPRQAMRTLHDAIRRGVPVYNHGDHRKCADIYMAACKMIVDSESDQMPQEVMDVLQRTVTRAKHMHHSGARAWALRHGMDSALGSMRQMSLASVE
ncbi:MAG: fasciclin domain-containing protein [Pirellulaceae bacterium]|nr:fasciclin domain-containing protein [Pirellulaceae bacterium]